MIVLLRGAGTPGRADAAALRDEFARLPEGALVLAGGPPPFDEAVMRLGREVGISIGSLGVTGYGLELLDTPTNAALARARNMVGAAVADLILFTGGEAAWRGSPWGEDLLRRAVERNLEIRDVRATGSRGEK